MSIPSRVLIIDTQPLFREGLVAALRRAWGGIHIDEADDMREGLEQIRVGSAEIVLVDIDAFSDPNAGALHDVVRACEPNPVIATSNRLEDVSSVMATGVRGYVTKTMSSADSVARCLLCSAAALCFRARLCQARRARRLKRASAYRAASVSLRFLCTLSVVNRTRRSRARLASRSQQ